MSAGPRGGGSRKERERAVREIVEAREIRTQRELVRALRERGIRVTQATVSRDVKRLGLLKRPGADGSYLYALPDTGGAAPPPAMREALAGAVHEFVTGLDEARGLLVVTTYPGCANAVAIAIDEARLPDVVGTVAGDDTIFILTRTDRGLQRVRAELEAAGRG